MMLMSRISSARWKAAKETCIWRPVRATPFQSQVQAQPDHGSDQAHPGRHHCGRNASLPRSRKTNPSWFASTCSVKCRRTDVPAPLAAQRKKRPKGLADKTRDCQMAVPLLIFGIFLLFCRAGWVSPRVPDIVIGRKVSPQVSGGFIVCTSGSGQLHAARGPAAMSARFGSPSRRFRVPGLRKPGNTPVSRASHDRQPDYFAEAGSASCRSFAVSPLPCAPAYAASVRLSPNT